MKYPIGTVLKWGPFFVEVKGVADDLYWVKWSDGNEGDYRTHPESELEGFDLCWTSMAHVYLTVDGNFSFDRDEDSDRYLDGFLIHWSNGEVEFRKGYCGDEFWKLKSPGKYDYPF